MFRSRLTVALRNTPFTRYNRLYGVNKHPTGCQTGCQTGLYNRFDNRLYTRYNRLSIVSDIAVFVLKRDVKLQLTN